VAAAAACSALPKLTSYPLIVTFRVKNVTSEG